VTWTTLIGAGGIVLRDGKILLVRQRRPYGTHWELPSGYHEPGETLEETAVREVLEETGIEIELAELAGTLLWERRHDRRRNLLTFFAGVPRHPGQEPVAQVEEDIEAAAFVDPTELAEGEIHPLNRLIFESWWESRAESFHFHVDISVDVDGTQSYLVRRALQHAP
jgi:ADP-ribose pyrophosphatase YjhB (NUDIX family)